MGFLSAAIQGGTSLLGGVLAEKQAKRARKDSHRQIQYKVEDARKAGIHPLYALGAPTSSYGHQVGSPIADSLASAGQDIGRAAMATSNKQGRVTAYTQKAQALQLTNMDLQNQLLASQVATSKLAQVPASPVGANWLIEGQGDTQTATKVNPHERTATHPGAPHMEAGAVPDVGHARTSTGYSPVPSKDVKERIEDNIIQEVMWMLRNQIMPTIGLNQSPPGVAARPGNDWWYNPFFQEYRQKRRRAPQRPPHKRKKHGY